MELVKIRHERAMAKVRRSHEEVIARLDRQAAMVETPENPEEVIKRRERADREHQRELERLRKSCALQVQKASRLKKALAPYVETFGLVAETLGAARQSLCEQFRQLREEMAKLKLQTYLRSGRVVDCRIERVINKITKIGPDEWLIRDGVRVTRPRPGEFVVTYPNGQSYQSPAFALREIEPHRYVFTRSGNGKCYVERLPKRH